MTSDSLKQLQLKLGRRVDQGGLDAIPRAISRQNRPMPDGMQGFDMWNAYEVSFLLPNGKPVVFHLQARYDVQTSHIVESKSFKLYLNGMNNRRFEDRTAFLNQVSLDLTSCVGGTVQLKAFDPDQSPPVQPLPGRSLDHLNPTSIPSEYAASHLTTAEDSGSFCFHSHLLRSQCPVTHQPDWGSVLIRGKGSHQPNPETLLAYLLSFRNHPDFHETCCETIFSDLHLRLKPNQLEVICRYTRRGGLDINPVRTTGGFNTSQMASAWRQ